MKRSAQHKMGLFKPGKNATECVDGPKKSLYCVATFIARVQALKWGRNYRIDLYYTPLLKHYPSWDLQ